MAISWQKLCHILIVFLAVAAVAFGIHEAMVENKGLEIPRFVAAGSDKFTHCVVSVVT